MPLPFRMSFRTPRAAARPLLPGVALTLSLPLALALSAPPALAGPAAAAQQASAPQQSPYGGAVAEEIVARVNDQIITRSDYDRAEQSLESEAQQRGVTPQQLEAGKRDLLRGLIDQQLLLSKGKELGITGETELVKRLDEIRKQNHLGSMEDLEKAAKEQGVSFEDFKASIRNQIITQQVVGQEVSRHMQITHTDMLRYYEEHKQDFAQPESVHLSEILISVPAPAPSATEKGGTEPEDPEKLATAKAKAEDAYQKLKEGTSFASVAKSVSDGPTAQQGGDLGTFRRGMLAKVLEEKTFDLKPGEFTEPVRTKQGYIILKVDSHVHGGVPSFEEVQPEVEQAVYQERMDPALRDYLKKLREQAFIDIKPGFVDSGASSAQTKIVYSAYATPGPKKKKKAQLARFREKPTGNRPALRTVSAPRTPGPASTPATDSAAAPAGSPATASPAAGGTMKPGKKEKIRFGQAPRETLPTARTETRTEDAGALPAANVADAGEPQPANPLEPPPPPKGKTRFSQRPRESKEERQQTEQVTRSAETPSPASSEEVADRQTQSTPLGLGGDAAAQKKKKADTSGKTRFADEASRKKEEQQPPAQGSPAPAGQQP